mmetsp:Transcript_109661/g.217765  ORF Transcript_109661/g.217765 Transcript_109661/m.217765 type:complete len:265 (+) Transcript_109661:1736-2530(+)
MSPSPLLDSLRCTCLLSLKFGMSILSHFSLLVRFITILQRLLSRFHSLPMSHSPFFDCLCCRCLLLVKFGTSILQQTFVVKSPTLQFFLRQFCSLVNLVTILQCLHVRLSQCSAVFSSRLSQLYGMIPAQLLQGLGSLRLDFNTLLSQVIHCGVCFVNGVLVTSSPLINNFCSTITFPIKLLCGSLQHAFGVDNRLPPLLVSMQFELLQLFALLHAQLPMLGLGTVNLCSMCLSEFLQCNVRVRVGCNFNGKVFLCCSRFFNEN